MTRSSSPPVSQTSGRASFDIEQNIYLDNLEGPLLLRGTVKAAYIDADSLRPMRVPASLFEEN